MTTANPPATAGTETDRGPKNRFAEQVKTLGSAVRKATDELRQDDQLGIARQADRLGEQMERMSEHIRSRSPSELTRELEDLARREPAWFIGGAFLVGLLGARFLKSSSRRRDAGMNVDMGGESEPFPSS